MHRVNTQEEARPTRVRLEYDEHGDARQNRPQPMTLDDHDRADEHLALRGLRSSARRRHRADELTSARLGWRYYRVIGREQQGSGTVEAVAMALGAILVLGILGGAAYRAMGCQGADQGCVSDHVGRFLRQRLP